MTLEANFDGLVGPTHNYAGLSFGNLASSTFGKTPSNPKAAALQGLDKMRHLHSLGIPQGVLAPNSRPELGFLKQLGFNGTREQIIKSAYAADPALLSACYSASSMWTANAATVISHHESLDAKVHFIPANLHNKLHRAIEAPQTSRILAATFKNDAYFTHHAPLPAHAYLGDEGAANHTRLTSKHDAEGIHLFVYGKSTQNAGPKHYPARQTLEASQAVARKAGLTHKNSLFVQQNPEVIDAGVFHNDVIAVGNERLLFCHQDAYVNQQAVMAELTTRLKGRFDVIEVPRSAVSVQDAVGTYLFNSQLVSLPSGNMALIAPIECQEHPKVASFLAALCQSHSILKEVHYVDLRQSMQNGGGPACLRLRVPLSRKALDATNPYALMNDALHTTLSDWVKRHYRDTLTAKDLLDPRLIDESYAALDELTQILHLGSIYPFQQE